MSIWRGIEQLAKNLLGTSAPKVTNFSQEEARIIPEIGKQQHKKYSSYIPPKLDIEVLPEYDFIYQALLQKCPCIFVTGKAGTGKSTLIDWLQQELSSCAIVAPTAIAAIQVNGDTIHSFFGLPAQHIDPDQAIDPNDKIRLVLENLNYLIVDEVSMVLPNIVDVINNILKNVRNNDLPFGGISVVFVGDLLQLPPVVSTPEEVVYYSHRYKTPYFFSADIFKSLQVMPVHLTKVRRQTDEDFINALNHIRLNETPREHIALFNRRCYRDKDKNLDTGIYLVTTNAAAKTINTQHLSKIAGEAQIYNALVTGNLPMNKWKLNVPDRLELKIGARVILLKNKKPDWVNGDLAEIVGLEENLIRVKKLKSDNILIVQKETWTKYKYTYDYSNRKIERMEVGTFQQYPIALGWAITIHKSQGLTLENLTIDLGNGAFCEGQVYVALSRAKTIEGITLSKPISIRDVKVNQHAKTFLQNISN